MPNSEWHLINQEDLILSEDSKENLEINVSHKEKSNEINENDENDPIIPHDPPQIIAFSFLIVSGDKFQIINHLMSRENNANKRI